MKHLQEHIKNLRELAARKFDDANEREFFVMEQLTDIAKRTGSTTPEDDALMAVEDFDLESDDEPLLSDASKTDVDEQRAPAPPIVNTPSHRTVPHGQGATSKPAPKKIAKKKK